jgi:hypothetical protein
LCRRRIKSQLLKIRERNILPRGSFAADQVETSHEIRFCTHDIPMILMASSGAAEKNAPLSGKSIGRVARQNILMKLDHASFMVKVLFNRDCAPLLPFHGVGLVL